MMKKSFKKNELSVAAVVGTIMALMVFLAFMALFQLHYVPVMMTDNESNHFQTVLNQFGSLKQTIDNAIFMDQRDVTMYTTITMGASGVPAFASETWSRLAIKVENKSGVWINNTGIFNVTVDSPTDWNMPYANSSGLIGIHTPYRYYLRIGEATTLGAKVIYENGAVILWQQTGEWLENPPHFNIVKQIVGANIGINMSLLQVRLIGEDRETGYEYGAEGIQTKLWWVHTMSENFGITGKDVYIRIQSDFWVAWRDYFRTVLTEKGFTENVNPTAGEFYIDETYTNTQSTIILIIGGVNNLQLKLAHVEVALGAEAMP